MYRYIFGPVPSRRLGISLGIDLIPPKTCSMDCIYCECGRTTSKSMKRRPFIPPDEVIEELTHYLDHNPSPDYVTLSGSGEPTLNSEMGKVIDFLASFPDRRYRIAVITNASLLWQADVRRELLRADVIMPSLDAATAEVFERINRPHPDLTADKMVEGLAQLREQFRGEIWLEVFVVHGLNDTKQELDALRRAIGKIRPDRVQLNTLDRPGTESWVRPASPVELRRIIDYWRVDAEIIARGGREAAGTEWRRDVESAILETISRRPCTAGDLAQVLCLTEAETSRHIERLIQAGKVVQANLQGKLFYRMPKHPAAE
ncbi:MAG: radical SAM protein [Deltaproteobacteria bacterium]|nr:MAG: radical SAM protein [Deltaproteobacteria bacterium]